MQSAGVVDVVDEGADAAPGVFASTVRLAVTSSAFSVRMKLSALALSLGSPAGSCWRGRRFGKPLRVVAAGVLHAAIGMVDQVLQRAAARDDCLVERLDRQAAFR